MEKIINFLFSGKHWIIVYLKWVIICMIICTIIIWLIYPGRLSNENLLVLLKAHFFLSLYMASIPTLFSQKTKKP
jgi:hypothetical protein